MAIILPGLGLAAGLPQHPVADWQDQPAFFRQRDETIRRNAPEFGVVPAQQAFETDDGAAGDVYLRLVVEGQFPAQQDPAQIVFHVQALGALFGDLAVEETEAAQPVFLGAVHREVGVAQQFGGVVAILRGEGDAGASGGNDVRILETEGIGHRVDQLAGQGFQAGQVVAILDDDGEQAAAEVAEDVLAAEQAAQAPGDRGEQEIAGLVAEGVIDPCQLVDIDKDDGARLAGGQPVAEQFGEAWAVGEPGQLVDIGQRFETGLAGLALRQVGNEDPPIDDIAGLIADRGHIAIDRAGRAFLAQDGEFAVPSAIPGHLVLDGVEQ